MLIINKIWQILIQEEKETLVYKDVKLKKWAVYSVINKTWSIQQCTCIMQAHWPGLQTLASQQTMSIQSSFASLLLVFVKKEGKGILNYQTKNF